MYVMSCHNCVCRLMFGIHEGGWGLLKVKESGYSQELLGPHPLVPKRPEVLVFRLNVHYPIKEGIGKSLQQIEVEAEQEGHVIERSPCHQKQPKEWQKIRKGRSKTDFQLPPLTPLNSAFLMDKFLCERLCL